MVSFVRKTAILGELEKKPNEPFDVFLVSFPQNLKDFYYFRCKRDFVVCY